MSTEKNENNRTRISNNSDGGFLTDRSELQTIHKTLLEFIKETVTKAGANGVVVGMSGGIDSTLTAMLAVQALGNDRVLGLALPARKADDATREARTMAEGLGIEFREISLCPLVDCFEDLVAPQIDPGGTQKAVGNVVTRLRMACLYYAANTQSRLVLGTTNRSELLLGYFTKFGDGAADLCPLGDLYKTEVRALAYHVGVPRRIIAKEPTADLWNGQTDADEIGARYENVDPILQHLLDRGKRVEDAIEDLDADPETVERVAEMYVDSLHKRTVPPTPGVDGRGRGKKSYPLHLVADTDGL